MAKAWYIIAIAIAIAIAILRILLSATASSRQMPLPRRNIDSAAGGAKLTEAKWTWMGDGVEVPTGVSGLGSRPPGCLNKCAKCRPCEATQVPTTTQKMRLHYANYEPEGWKCKCGATFFNP